MNENPYSSSATNPITDSAENRETESLQSIARAVFLAWEKLRLLYVAVLAIVTLAFTGRQLFNDTRILLVVVEGAIAANLAYFAGPTVETYVRWLGFKGTWPRWLMFAGGTLIAIILAIVSLVSPMFLVNPAPLSPN